MQVACTEHLNLPSFAILKNKPGEMSVKTFSPVPTGDYALWFVNFLFLFFFFFFNKVGDLIFMHENKVL